MTEAEVLDALRARISEATGFDAADEFASEAEVRDYFTAEAQEDMFGVDGCQDGALLESWAQAVIEHRWHCSF